MDEYEESLTRILNEEWCLWLLKLPSWQYRFVIRKEMEWFDAWDRGEITTRQLEDLAASELLTR